MRAQSACETWRQETCSIPRARLWSSCCSTTTVRSATGLKRPDRGSNGYRAAGARVRRARAACDRQKSRQSMNESRSLMPTDVSADIARGCPCIYAGYQEPLTAARGKQFKGIGDARVATSQHNDSVGVAVEYDFAVRHKPDEIAEAADNQERAKKQKLEPDGSHPPPPYDLSKAGHARASGSQLQQFSAVSAVTNKIV